MLPSVRSLLDYLQVQVPVGLEEGAFRAKRLNISLTVAASRETSRESVGEVRPPTKIMSCVYLGNAPVVMSSRAHDHEENRRKVDISALDVAFLARKAKENNPNENHRKTTQ
jgi:hypothetical protein